MWLARDLRPLSAPVVCCMCLMLQLLGLDYLVDSECHPWLLEVNGTPSLAVAHHDPAVEQLIQQTKVGARRRVHLCGAYRGCVRPRACWRQPSC